MEEMEAAFVSAVRNGDVPGAVVMAKNTSGEFLPYVSIYQE